MKKIFKHKRRLVNRMLRSGLGFISLALMLALLASAMLGFSKGALISGAVAEADEYPEANSAVAGSEAAPTSGTPTSQYSDAEKSNTVEVQPYSGSNQTLAALSAETEDGSTADSENVSDDDQSSTSSEQTETTVSEASEGTAGSDAESEAGEGTAGSDAESEASEGTAGSDA